MTARLESSETVGDLIEAVAIRLDMAGLFYGHGTDNPVDESAALVFHVCELAHEQDAGVYERPISAAQRDRAAALLAERIDSRKPLAFLLGEAWFAGLRFYVDERVLVPRSPIAELIVNRFEPWVDAERIGRILEIGTGSGCIAIACAHAFPQAQVVATDISADALVVATRNVQRHDLMARVRLVQTDHADDVEGEFDLIVTNPPYVPTAEQADLPTEYGFEPPLGLYSGIDGLDSARRILQDAPHLLSDQGALVLEVGAQWEALERAFPTIPFTWLEFESGGEGVALITRADIVGNRAAPHYMN
jgi:ribosomal protein L3 glutamine methyltransferase